MRVLHVLALLSALVLGGVGWAQYDLGAMSWWAALLLVLVGLVIPYAYALFWVLLVAPPSADDIRRGISTLRARLRRAPGQGGPPHST